MPAKLAHVLNDASKMWQHFLSDYHTNISLQYQPTVCAISILVMGSITVGVTGQITIMGFTHTVDLYLESHYFQAYL